ncbi:MAG: hypothetical protein ACK4NY_15060 [Spirosomataceae bacterium]
MSVRFVFLYCIVLVLTTCFFLNISPSGDELSLHEVNLVKLLNQTQTILLIGYLIFKVDKFYNKTIILLLITAYCIIFLSEFTFYLNNTDLMQFMNNFFIIVCRIITAYVFYKEGAKINNFSALKLLFIGVVLISIIGVIVNVYPKSNNFQVVFMGITTIVLILFLWLCLNRPVSLKNKLIALSSATFIVYGDCVYIYSSYISLLSFTSTWNRSLSAVADLLLIWAILEGIPKYRKRLA